MAAEKSAEDGFDAEVDDRPGSEFTPHYAEVKDDGTGRIESVMSEANVEPSLPAAATDDENLSKKEKKRREKEAKAREKKEQAEMKRRLKEQEQQLKQEAKKKTETPAEKRRKRRQEETKSGKATSSYLSSQHAGVRPKNLTHCRVRLLDGTEYELDIESNARGSLLVDMVCEHINLLEKDYFSCSYYDDEGIKYWIIPDRRIAKQIGKRDWVFDFGVKFYAPEPNVLQEEITRYQLCLQLRANIVSGKLPCSMVTAALLGAYTVQSELGDYDVREFGAGVDYLREFQFCPGQSDELLSKVLEIHRTLLDQSPAEADLNYLSNATKMELYGVELQDAQDAELINIRVGVCSSGIIVYRDQIRINHFAWPLVLKLSYKKQNFNVKIRPAAGEQYITTLTFTMPDRSLTKRFWRLATEIHSFFRLKTPLPLDRGVFARFGASKHRFSGRTFYQSHTWASSVTRPQPYFERSGSRMTTSLTTSSFIDEKAKAARRKELEASQTSEVAVVAGTGSDPAGRVAYVKTVQPGTVDQAAASYPGSAGDVHVYASPGYSNVNYEPSAAAGGVVKHMVVEADVNTDHGGAERRAAAAEVDDERQKKKKKKKTPKTTTTTTTTTTRTQNAYSDDEGNVVVESLSATDRNGVLVESNVERRQVTGRQDIDHDFELSRAINNVVGMDADLSVDKIEISPADVAATMSATHDRIHIAPVKKPKPQTKPRPHKAED